MGRVLAATGTAIMTATDMSVTALIVTGITGTTTGIAVGTDGKDCDPFPIESVGDVAIIAAYVDGDT